MTTILHRVGDGGEGTSFLCENVVQAVRVNKIEHDDVNWVKIRWLIATEHWQIGDGIGRFCSVARSATVERWGFLVDFGGPTTPLFARSGSGVRREVCGGRLTDCCVKFGCRIAVDAGESQYVTPSDR